jgi:hypothetical protein
MCEILHKHLKTRYNFSCVFGQATSAGPGPFTHNERWIRILFCSRNKEDWLGFAILLKYSQSEVRFPRSRQEVAASGRALSRGRGAGLMPRSLRSHSGKDDPSKHRSTKRESRGGRCSGGKTHRDAEGIEDVRRLEIARIIDCPGESPGLESE